MWPIVSLSSTVYDYIVADEAKATSVTLRADAAVCAVPECGTVVGVRRRLRRFAQILGERVDPSAAATRLAAAARRVRRIRHPY